MRRSRLLPRLILPAAVVAAGLAAAPAPARAQAPAQEEARERSATLQLQEALPPDVADRLRRLVADVRADGIPPSLLVDKALEGAAKGVSGERLVATVSAYADELREARSLIGPDIDATGLLAATNALRRGVPPGIIRGLALEHPARFEMLLLVHGDLLVEGVPPDEAYGVVQAALRRGLEGENLLSVPAAIRRLIREGEAPVDAAVSVERGLEQGRFPIPLQGRDRGVVPSWRPPTPPTDGLGATRPPVPPSPSRTFPGPR